jgi:hypothetical protein
MARFTQPQGRVQLALPRPEVENLIARHYEEGRILRSRGDDLLEKHPPSPYEDDELKRDYEEWVHDLERWHALTGTALESAFTTRAPSKEFPEQGEDADREIRVEGARCRLRRRTSYA